MFWNVASTTTVAFLSLSSRNGANWDKTTCRFRHDDMVLSAATTDLSFEEQIIDGEKYANLLEWMKDNEAEVNEKIEIRPSPQGYGFGAFVKEQVAEDELLFTVPRKICLTLQDATEDSSCGETFSKLMEKAGPGANTVVMAGYMAKEYLVMMEEIKNGKSPSGPWSAYFQTLPWKRGVNNQEHVLFWSNEMVEDLLKGSLCYGEATGLRDEVALATRVMTGIVGKPIRIARGEEDDEGFNWPWEAKNKGPEGPPEGLSDAMKGAFVCLLTRAFQDGDGDGDEEKLVPMLDMLQHSETPNVRHAMRTVDGTVEVRARCTIEPETELFNQYRSEEEENMPYSRFFTRFGFVPGIIEPIANLLKDKSSIFYPQKAEI